MKFSMWAKCVQFSCDIFCARDFIFFSIFSRARALLELVWYMYMGISVYVNGPHAYFVHQIQCLTMFESI